MDKKERLWFLFQFLHEVEKKMSREKEKQVMIEKAINIRLMCDYVVSCSYGDVVLIICMLHDYINMMDDTRADDIMYQAYYRGVFMKMADRLKGSYHPDRIIPFAIDRKKALEIFDQWIRTKKYVPRDFYSKDQIEKLTGVYFPYWLYDCQVRASLDARGDKVSTWAAGNIRYTKTDQYDVSRQGSMEVANVPRNALSKANRRLVEGVFPFDMTRQKEFHMGYLSGFFAENRDMEYKTFAQEVEQEVEAYAKQSLTSQIGDYNSVQVRSCQARLEKPSWKYTLLPVWTLTYKDKKDGKIYYFACNGESGKICGELPVDRGRLGRLFASIFLPVAAVLLALGYLMG